MCIKSDFKEIILKLATNLQSDKGLSAEINICPKGLSAPALGLCTCIKALQYIPGPVSVSVYRTIDPLVYMTFQGVYG